jgi:hypothetical protein
LFLFALAHSPLISTFAICRIPFITMDIIGRVLPVRHLKPFNRRYRDATQPDIAVLDHIPNHSIAAGISPIHMLMVTSATGATVTNTMNQQWDHPGHPSPSTPQNGSSLRRANNVARLGLNVVSPIAGGIPFAGTPLKAAIDALLVVLNDINVSYRALKNTSPV